MGDVIAVALMGAFASGAWVGFWCGREAALAQASKLPKLEITIDRKIIDSALAAVGQVAVPADEWVAASRALMREIEAEAGEEAN